MEFTAGYIANFLGGYVEGDSAVVLREVAEIADGHVGALSFLANPKYEHYLYTTASSAVLVNKTLSLKEPVRTTLIRVDDAYGSLARLLTMLDSERPRRRGVAPQAVVAESATPGEGDDVGPFSVIGENVVVGSGVEIYPHCYVGEGCVIGEGTTLYPRVTLYSNCEVGSHCILHSGAVIGADGFGFAATADGAYEKIPQIGRVRIADHVEIGANTTVDRAALGLTQIEEGVKIDNLVQVAHNVQIGEHTVIAAQSGIAGSTRVGAHCLFGGQVGLVGHIEIADGVQLGAQSGVPNSIRQPGEKYMGTPALPVRTYHRSVAVYKQLHELYQEVNRMREQLGQLSDGAIAARGAESTGA